MPKRLRLPPMPVPLKAYRTAECRSCGTEVRFQVNVPPTEAWRKGLTELLGRVDRALQNSGQDKLRRELAVFLARDPEDPHL